MVGLNRPARDRRALRRKLFKKQRGLCHWCGTEMSMEKVASGKRQRPDYATFEHVQPKSLGGSDSRSNIVLAHAKCNHARGNGEGHETKFGYAGKMAREFARMFGQ